MTTMLEYFRSETQTQWPSVEQMILGGIRVDQAALDEVRKEVTHRLESAQAELQKEMGWLPNVKSWKDMAKVFESYGVKTIATSTNRPAIGEEHILGYAHSNPQARRALQLCLQIVEQRTLVSNFLGMTLDTNGFYHPFYNINKTITGRLSSNGADEGGPQLQNIPNALRRVFIADEPSTDELTFGDLKQAELMVVAYDSQDPFLIAAFESGLDVHRVRACTVFRGYIPSRGQLPPASLMATITEVCPACSAQGEKKCNHSERFIQKQSGHAFNYEMGTNKYVRKILPPLGIYMPESEAKRIRAILITEHIRNWQSLARIELSQKPWLTNLVGRRKEFYGRLDQETIRQALAWKASSVVSHITARAMRVAHETFQNNRDFRTTRIITQTHDSLGVTHPKSLREPVRSVLHRAFRFPVTVHGREMVIPLDVASGPNWRDAK